MQSSSSTYFDIDLFKLEKIRHTPSRSSGVILWQMLKYCKKTCIIIEHNQGIIIVILLSEHRYQLEHG